MELVILLILLVVGVVFGLGVVVVSTAPPRRRAGAAAHRRRRCRGAAKAPTEVEPELEAEVEEALAPAEKEVVEEVAEPEVVERPRFRDRLARPGRSSPAPSPGCRARRHQRRDLGRPGGGPAARRRRGGLTTELLDGLRDAVKAQEITEPDRSSTRSSGDAGAAGRPRPLAALRRAGEGAPDVWLFVGVNGVGKTTTIGKVAAQQAAEGRTVVMAAGDTFRAAAAEQLATWAERAGADFVRGAEGGDPSAVIFDAVQRAAARGADLVLADTAGRLHTKTNLMEELRKVRRVADREPGHVTEVLLVIDATTGQNGLTQARQFAEAVEVTGVVLTKLDGSAKGGIVLAIQTELGMPVKLVGLGETIADLVAFDPDEFVDALFEE